MDYFNSLTLYEQILLLALKDKEGTISVLTDIETALASSILAELILQKKITFENNKTPVVLDENSDDEILKEALELFKESDEIQTIFSEITTIDKLYYRVAEKLCSKKILKADEEKFLLFFKQKIYPELNPEPEKYVISEIRNAVIYSNAEISPKIVVILSILKNLEMLNSVFNKEEENHYKDRIDSIIKGDKVGEIAKEVIEAIQVAVVLTIIIPSLLTTTIITS